MTGSCAGRSPNAIAGASSASSAGSASRLSAAASRRRGVQRARWTPQRRLAAALKLLADPALDALLAPAIAFGDLPAQLPAIFAPDSGVLCQLIDYR